MQSDSGEETAVLWKGDSAESLKQRPEETFL